VSDHLLGIDVGTNSCKTIIIDSAGKITDLTSREYKISTPQYGWAEQHPEDWFNAFKDGLKEILERKPYLSNNISAIGLTGQMVGLTLLDKNLHVLHPAIIWMDQRCQKQVDYLRKNLEDVIRNITYNTLQIYHTVAKILWVKENIPDVWKNVYKIQLPKDYIRLILTQKWYTDVNDASATMMLDMKNLKWSDEIIGFAKIDKNKLPELIESYNICGNLNKDIATELGLIDGIPVITGAGDLASENFSTGILNSSLRLSRLGTSASTSTVIDSPLFDPHGISQCFAYFIPHKWIIESTYQSFGLSQKWFRDTFFSEEKVKIKKEKKDIYALMSEMAEKVPIGSEGLFFNPFNSGSPYWNPNLRGAFYGVSLSHNKEHFTRAVFEGSAYGLKDTVMYLDDLINISNYEYILVGGGSKSKVWSQIICDILRKNAFILENADAALGAAMLAGVGTSVFKDFKDAIKKCVKTKRKIVFDNDNSKKYKQLYTVFKEIHKDLMDKSDLIQRTLKDIE